jgi:hypothetical protein
MRAGLRFGMALVVLCAGVGAMTGAASAASVDIIKRCEAQANNEFPLIEPGNPAAGRAKGTQSFQQYYGKCIADSGRGSGRAGSVAPPSTTGSASSDSIRREYAEPEPYKPCPASVARNGRSFCER